MNTSPDIAPKEFFQTSDVISLHCPLTSETTHLINEETLQLPHRHTN